MEALKKASAAFKREFQTSKGEPLQVNEAPAEAMESDDVGQETVKRYRQPRPPQAQG